MIAYKGHTWIKRGKRPGIIVSDSFTNVVLLTGEEYKRKTSERKKEFRRLRKSDVPFLDKLNLGVRE